MSTTLLLTAIAVITGFLALAKSGRGKRRMGRYIKGNIDLDFALGTLAPQDVVVSAIQDTVNERSLISSVVATYTLSGYTVIDNAGPIMVGVAHSDYSDAEIEAWIENSLSWDEGDLAAQEIANRKIRKIGMIPMVTSLASSPLNDGKPIKTRLNWIVNQGQSLKFWAYNHGTAALATTDPDMHVDGHANVWPR